MSTRFIKYRSKYKYQLAEEYRLKIPLQPKKVIETEFINLDCDGILVVASGYAWDGPSGHLVDTTRNMRASLVHDALYQLMRHEHLKSRRATYRVRFPPAFRLSSLSRRVRVW